MIVKNINLFITILCILFFKNFFAQNGDWYVIQAQYKNLPNPNINAIEIDDDGNKWVGTNGGIGKFNGEEWIQYTMLNSSLLDSQITSISIDQNKMIWVGTKGAGIAVFDGISWSSYSVINSELADNYIHKLVSDYNGRIWVISGQFTYNLQCFDGVLWKTIEVDSTYFKEGIIKDLEVDESGKLWFGRRYGLSTLQDTLWEHYDLPSSFDVRTSIIEVDIKNDKIICGSDFGTFLKLEEQTWSKIELFPFSNITSITTDLNNNNWIASSDGIAMYDGHQFSIFNTNNCGLISDLVDVIKVDNENNIWVGTFLGLSKFDGLEWNLYSASLGLPSNQISSIEIDSMNIKWIGSSNLGLSKFDGKVWSNYNTSNSDLPNNNIKCLKADGNKNIWVGTNKGLVIYDGSSWQIFDESNSPMPETAIKDIEIDSKGNKWIVTENYLFKFDNKKWEQINIPSYNELLNTIAIDSSDNLWVGTIWNGFYKYSDKVWTNFNSSNSLLPHNTINKIKIDNNQNVWIGTANGLVKIKHSEWDIFSVDNSNIGGNDVADIVFDKTGNIWIGLFWFKGISKYDGQSWLSFNRVIDPIANGITVFKLSIDRYNNLWCGDWNQGLAIFNEAKVVNVAKKEPSELAQEYKLYQNFPNPFNPITVINYSVPTSSNVKIIIYDITGSLVKSFDFTSQSSGYHRVEWNGTNEKGIKVSSGMYIYRMEAVSIDGNAERFVQNKKMILLK